MAAYKTRHRNVMKFPSLLIAFLMVMTLGFTPKIVEAAAYDGSVTLEGYNVDTKDWTGDWTTGNLAKSYQEGETFPGRAHISDFQSLYPGFENFPDLTFWYTSVYPMNGGAEHGIFVDLVKGIQVGTRELTNAEGWPKADGTAYPLGTPELVNIAQNHPGENAWSGYSLLNLPNEQINRSAETGTIGGIGDVFDEKRCFIVTAEDIINALIAEGKDPNVVDDFYIYFEFHLARTSIYSRNLQDYYTEGAPASWGGYIFDELNFDPVDYGAGPSPGSSGHFGMLDAKGSRDVQLPDTPETYRDVTGRKFLDANNNGMYDEGEVGLPGWTINLVGFIEDIEVPLTTTTDAEGYYYFNDLSYGSELYVHEMMQENYFQTYPNKVESLPIGATSYYEEVPGEGSWRWYIPSMMMPASGDLVISGVDFGNFLPDPKIEVVKTGDLLSKIGDTIKFTVTVKNTGNVDLELKSIVDDQFGPLDAVTVPGGFGATLLKGAEESHEFEMAIPEGAVDPFINKVTAIYSYLGAEATADAQHETNLFQPDYEITKTVDKAGAVPGETVRYTITVKNNSSSDTPLTSFVLTDELLGWTGADVKTFDLLPGEEKVFSDASTDYMIPADAVRGSIIKNEASFVTSFMDFPNTYEGSAFAETKVLMPEIKITKTGDELSKIGDLVTFNFVIENIGDVPLQKFKVYDDTFMEDITSKFLKDTLAVGETDTASFSFMIPEGASDPFINKVSAVYKYVAGAFEMEAKASSDFSVNLFQPEYSIEKTVDKLIAIPGETVRYKITVKNLSSEDTPLTRFTLTDELLGWTGADAKTFDLASGGEKVFEGPETDYVIPAGALDGSIIRNEASFVTKFDDFTNVYRGSASVETTVLVPALKITKTGDAFSKIGDEVTYKFVVENIGSVDLHKVKIYDETMKEDLTALFTKDILKPGESEEVTKKFVIPEDAEDPFKNVVTAEYKYVSGAFEKSFTADSSHVVDLFQPSYSIAKTVDKSEAVPGETVHYIITIKNTSSADTPETKFVVTDEKLGWVGADAKTFSLKSGESMVFDDASTDYMIPLDAERGAIISNIVTFVTSFENFPNEYKGRASADTKVLMLMLEITKKSDELSKIGDPVTYTFTVKNTGDVPLELVKVYDETFDFDLTSLFTKTVLGVGETDAATKEFVIPENAGDPFENKVTATYNYVNGQFVKPVVETSTFSINLFQPGITIEKTADKAVSMIGDTITYKIIVKNTSSMDAPDLVYTVEDDVYGLVVKDAELASGASKEYTYSYLIKEGDPNPLKNTASVTASPKGFPNVLTDEDSHEIKLFTPDIKIEKMADTEISKVGDTIVYTIKVTNLTAESYAPDMKVRVTDMMLGLDETFNLASGAVKTITVNYVVKEADDPDYMTKYGWTELKNTVKLMASPMGFEAISSFELSASATVNLVHPRIDLEKSVNTNIAHVGDTLTYTVKITNTGDVDLVNIAVNDTMLGSMPEFVTTLVPGASDEHSYQRLLTVADIGMLENTAYVLANPRGLPNKITDEDSETVEVRPRLYDETGWAYLEPGKSIPINTLVTAANWGWTNGPLTEGSYKFTVYTGAGQNDVSKALNAGTLYVEYIGGKVTFRYVMNEGFSLMEVHLYAGKAKLPEKKTGKTTVTVADPGQFPYKPLVPDQATVFEYTPKDKFSGDIYIAAHCVAYVPYWEMNSFYNTTKY
ncbi:DUF11 domain-containing protein [Proteiniclasticum sp. SCR006]|uniref:DUF11 domain-containing protein n=1 Tax=Proteiniclasticum aestuarii TaxID=2817862 RepID=A0A939HDH3_9CLOT|nr:SdrD B-like domain-containing protein [Proteiniclasticum aestuarii]MBO1265550.1 DUF11 domain-containing protein [Proteiniclasticum aestuarii]